MTEITYPLAPQGVFHTLQGEGTFLGEPQVFVRLGGCPVGCPGCDTDYSVAGRATAREIASMAAVQSGPGDKWAWVTGGEPAVYDLGPLTRELHRAGFLVAIATSGIRSVRTGPLGGADFVSVSPHKLDESWVLRRGDQVNLVFGLNGLTPADAEGVDFSGFPHRYCTPLFGDAGSLRDCLAWVESRAGWRLGIQAHKVWGVA